jgi:DNA-binding IclR family transcriptional regulator
MANAVRDYAVIGQLALKGLRTHTNDTIHLALLAGDEAVYIEKLEGNRAYESVSKVGLHLQLHCTAIGKAILAALPDAACDELLQRLPLPRRTPHTLTDLPTLRRELALTRARQFAFDDEENEESVRCVGAAFRDQHDAVVGAVSVSAPVFTMSMEDAIAVAPAVLAAAGAVSIALGASPGHTAAFRQRQTPGTSSHCPCPSGSVPPASARRSDDAAVDLPTTHQSGHVNAVDRRTTQQAWSHD